LFKKLSKDSELLLGFEPSTERGEIVDSRRGNRWYSLSFLGRESHAGRAPQKGINAAYIASKVMVELEKLNNYKKNISVSVGGVRSTKNTFNVVCEELNIKVDFRYDSFSARDAVDKKIRAIVKSTTAGASNPGAKAKVSIKVVDDCPPMARFKETTKISTKYAQLITAQESKKCQAVATGGSADVCYMSRPGLIALDGLGAVGGKMHSTAEWVDLSSLSTRSAALSEFLNFWILEHES